MAGTQTTKRPTLKGFSLIELAMVLLIFTIVTTIAVQIGGSLLSASRSDETLSEASRIYTAVVGDPSRNYYGYVGDTGRFPSSLMDLVRSPGVTGWNGPYLTGAHIESGALADPYGSPYECYYYSDTTNVVPDHFVVLSRGADLKSSNTASTPNTCTTYNGSTISASYAQSGDDADNVVFPRFTDNSTLLGYNHVGTLAITLFNFDKNSLVNAMVPGCPHLYTITVTSVSRSTDTFTMPYNPGANSVDLPQGIYKVSVTSAVQSGDVWQDQVTITPGSTTSRTANIYAGLDSSATTTQTFAPLNSYGSTLTLFNFSTNMGSVVNNGTGTFGANNPKACGQIYAQTSFATVVDAFVLPNLGTTYNRRISQSSQCTLTIVNHNSTSLAVRNQVRVLDGGLFIGIVTSRGAYKSKEFYSVRQGNSIVVQDTTSPTPQTLTSTTMGCPTTIDI